MKKSLLVFAALMVGTFAKAQTNAQILYDFGSDRKYVTLTLEMFKADKWEAPTSSLTMTSTTTKW